MTDFQQDLNKLRPADIFFHEEQQFRQAWIWLPLIILCVGIGYLFANTVIEQLLGQAKPVAGYIIALCIMFCLFFSIGLPVLFYTAKLTTEVRADGLYIRYFPFHQKYHRIDLSKLTKHQTLTYRPVRDYGGYGIKYNLRGGKVYNVSGHRGVRLDFPNNKHLLVGSQRPEELTVALARIVSLD